MRLVLVFSRFMSLSRWHDLGMFEREVAIYRRLVERGAEVGFLTWGGPEEFDFAAMLPGISILCNRFRLPLKRYEKLAPFLHLPTLLRADAIKTNQASAATIALPAARLWRKPLIARMGFMASDFAGCESGHSSPDFRREQEQEDRLFAQASAIVVTTKEMAEGVRRRQPGIDGRLFVTPNYVDTSLFAPHPVTEAEFDVLFVGRLDEQKNIACLLDALSRSGARALVVGDGPLSPLVRDSVEAAQGRLFWRSKVPHGELPSLMARSRLFVLPSLWEGHPKALLEAMSCGMAVIGANSPGVRDVIDPHWTGVLCEPDPAALAMAITDLLADPALRSNLGEAARKYILSTCSLDRIVQREEDVIAKALRGAI